jgi:hypothetical protein
MICSSGGGGGGGGSCIGESVMAMLFGQPLPYTCLRVMKMGKRPGLLQVCK